MDVISRILRCIDVARQITFLGLRFTKLGGKMMSFNGITHSFTNMEYIYYSKVAHFLGMCIVMPT